MLLRDESGHESEAQITAFEDTWHWDHSSEATYWDLLNNALEHIISSMINALRQSVGANPTHQNDSPHTATISGLEHLAVSVLKTTLFSSVSIPSDGNANCARSETEFRE